MNKMFMNGLVTLFFILSFTGCNQTNPSSQQPPIKSTSTQMGHSLNPEFDAPPKLSGKVVFHRQDGIAHQIHVVNLESGQTTQLTFAGDNIEPSWSPDGTKIAYACDNGNKFEICTMDADGENMRQLTNNSNNDWAPDWSPDGKYLVYVSSEIPFAHLHILNLESNESRRLLSAPGNEGAPKWSPDGKFILFMSDRGSKFNLYKVHSDASNETQVTDNGQDDRPSWSFDGNLITFRRQTISTAFFDGSEIIVADADGGNSVQLTNNTIGEDWPTFSPDGKWILYSATESEAVKLFVLPVEGGNPAPLLPGGVFGSAPDWYP